MKSKTNGHERGQALLEYALIITLLAVVIIAVLTLVGSGSAEVTFDQKWDKEAIMISSNYLPAGSDIAHPKPIELPSFMVPVNTGNHLLSYPRAYDLSYGDCLYLYLPTDRLSLHAAAPVSSEIAYQIGIQMPTLVGSRLVTVCAPDEVTTVVYLWATK